MTLHDYLTRLEPIVLVGIGGFAGANLRYFVGGFFPGLAGTLLVNAAGSFVLGIVLYESIYTGTLTAETRFVVGTGFLSSLTTYSTFALESARSPTIAMMAGNVLATYALGFAAVLLGRAVARRVARSARNGGASA